MTVTQARIPALVAFLFTSLMRFGTKAPLLPYIFNSYNASTPINPVIIARRIAHCAAEHLEHFFFFHIL